MPHFAGRRPFGELDLGDQFWLHPRGDGLILDPNAKRRRRRSEGHELTVHLLQYLVGEARSDVSDIAPPPAVAKGQNQGTEMGARSAWRGKAGNHHFLASSRLDLEPIGSARARQIFARLALGHDAFKALIRCFLEEFDAILWPVSAEGQQWMFGDEAAELRLAVNERQPAQILPIEKQEIEDGIA